MASSNQRIEVNTSTERRRQWATLEKKNIVDETYPSGMNVSLIAQKYDIKEAGMKQLPG